MSREGILDKLAPIYPGKDALHVNPMAIGVEGHEYAVGIGLHDSSAALIPYLINFHEPFILISTGTWCISLNPFNRTPLTNEELQNDCLCYMTYEGNPVKASRLFSGNEHEQQLKRIAEHFNQNINHYRDINFDADIIAMLQKKSAPENYQLNLKASAFTQRDHSTLKTGIEAYHKLVLDIVVQQHLSTQFVLK